MCLRPHILKLLAFIEQSIREAQSDPASRALLEEAGGALIVIQRTLIREAPEKNAQMMLLGVFDSDLSDLASTSDHEFEGKSEEKLQLITFSRQLFE